MITAALFFIIMLPLYFLPSIIASRGHKAGTGQILLFNLFFGWTGVGWIIALYWSHLKDRPDEIEIPPWDSAMDLALENEAPNRRISVPAPVGLFGGKLFPLLCFIMIVCFLSSIALVADIYWWNLPAVPTVAALVFLVFARIAYLVNFYSSYQPCKLFVGVLLLSAFLPTVSFTQWAVPQALDSIGQIFSANAFSGIVSHDAWRLIEKSGPIAFVPLLLIVVPLFIRAAVFPKPYLKTAHNGLLLGAKDWSDFIGERDIYWDDIEFVTLSRNKKEEPVLRFKLGNGSCSIPWKTINEYADAGQLINDLKEHCLDAIGEIASIRQDAGDQSLNYTELWMKYFTASTARSRSGFLQAGEKLHEGRYEIAGELGQGGQGTAYLASSSAAGENAGGETIVLKEYILPVHRGEAIFQQSMRKLQQEAEILGKISHSGIVGLKDTFVEDHRGYLVLEYVEGYGLKELVQKEGPQPQSVVIELALQLCDSIEYLHSMDPPIIHRDLSPDNMILQPDGRLKLVDFNVAHQLEWAATATVVGKHAYIPPEQFRGKPSERSDIFAFGGTLFYLLIGKDPEPLSVSHPRKHNEFITIELDQIVAKATALDQSLRYASIAEMRKDLQLEMKKYSIQTNVLLPTID